MAKCTKSVNPGLVHVDALKCVIGQCMNSLAIRMFVMVGTTSISGSIISWMHHESDRRGVKLPQRFSCLHRRLLLANRIQD